MDDDDSVKIVAVVEPPTMDDDDSVKLVAVVKRKASDNAASGAGPAQGGGGAAPPLRAEPTLIVPTPSELGIAPFDTSGKKSLGKGGYHVVYDIPGHPELIARVKLGEYQSSLYFNGEKEKGRLKQLIEFCEAHLKFPTRISQGLEFCDNMREALDATEETVPQLLPDLLAIYNSKNDLGTAVNIQDGWRKMRKILKNDIMVEKLLPSVVTSYNDDGVQICSKCYVLQRGGELYWKGTPPPNGGSKLIDLEDADMAKMVDRFMSYLDQLKGAVPFFDGKLGNIGAEIIRPSHECVLRIIDVDVDAGPATIQSIMPGDKQHQFNNVVLDNAITGPQFTYYQSMFSVIVAMLDWVDVDNVGGELNYKVMGTPASAPPSVQTDGSFYWSMTTSSKPRLRRVAASMAATATQYPQTVAVLDRYFETLCGTPLAIPDKFRAAFTDLPSL